MAIEKFEDLTKEWQDRYLRGSLYQRYCKLNHIKCGYCKYWQTDINLVFTNQEQEVIEAAELLHKANSPHCNQPDLIILFQGNYQVWQ